jgi:putative flavoprotein involved in K+ transport
MRAIPEKWGVSPTRRGGLRRYLRPMEKTTFDVIVIGGGQAGLSMGYQLKQRGVRFVILDANARIGDAWRQRWDSLRLFSPARYDGLAGMPFPAPPDAFPTKDEMADYLEAYAARFELPVLTGVRVDKLTRVGARFFVRAGQRQFEAAQVVVAMANLQKGLVPAFARELAPDIVQLHSMDYKNPAQLREGGVLLVGAGNSGAEIAVELAAKRRVWLAGRHPGEVPFDTTSFLGQLVFLRLLFRVLFHRVLTIKTPMGRKARLKAHSGTPLIRQKSKQLAAAGVTRAPRVVGVKDGRPLLADGRALDVANVIWCSGFDAGFSWIDLPILDEAGLPRHEGGVVAEAPGLYFTGLHFLYAFSSTMIHGLERDAARIGDAVAASVVREGRERLAA